MCDTCGCSNPLSPHAHGPAGKLVPAGAVISLERDLLSKNERLAQQNRLWFRERGIAALNLMSSPGAGKTTLLERTIARLPEHSIHVIEGDQATAHDAERIRKAGAKAVQINTGAGCHLDAHMVQHALGELEPASGSFVMIENVGNLVCPALFDLGEVKKVVIFSVTEGDDKPLKYPHMFRAADVMVINKIDLLPYVECNLERVLDHARRIKPEIVEFRLSATRGDGMDEWCEWLQNQRQASEAK